MQDMDFLKSFHTAAALLPERLWKAAYSLDESQRLQCEEFRVRLGRPLMATVAISGLPSRTRNSSHCSRWDSSKE